MSGRQLEIRRLVGALVALASLAICATADALPSTVWPFEPSPAYQAAAQRLAELRAATTDPSVRDSNLPLAALALERWRRTAGAGFARTADLDVLLGQATAALDRCAAGQAALAGLTGSENAAGCLERAYFAANDDSPQPYYVRLPADYDPARRYPLVVFLHGYVADTSKLNPWLISPSQWQAAADRGLILVVPHGRSNTDFLGVGEQDTLAVIDEMQRFYSIDPDRIHLSGASMGGYGAWAIGLRQPSRFASLSTMCGQTDFFDWERRSRDETPFKTWLICQNNPLDLAVNAGHLPMLVQHGELDPLVPVEHSRRMVARLRELGLDVTYREYPGQGHYIYWEDEPFERVFDFVADKVRLAEPPTVTFRTFTPRQGVAYWLDVRRLQSWGPPADVTATIADGALSLTCTNVAELYLDPPVALRGAGHLAVSLNGTALGTLGAGSQRLSIAGDGAASLEAAEPPATRPTVGPAREVFNAPFIVVAPLATPGSEARAAAFARFWAAFAEGEPAVYRDSDLTAELVAAHNLVVFGPPDAPHLPGLDCPALVPGGVIMTAGRYGVGDRSWPAAETGMTLLTRHPTRADGLILWWAGEPYGAALSHNHQFDLLPDLLIYGRTAAWDGANTYLAGGFLSPDFVLQPDRIDYGPPAP